MRFQGYVWQDDENKTEWSMKYTALMRKVSSIVKTLKKYNNKSFRDSLTKRKAATPAAFPELYKPERPFRRVVIWERKRL
jgi:hypothetical protein